VSNYGLFFLLIDPEILIPAAQYHARVSELRRTIAANRPIAGTSHVRVPGDSSLQRRKEGLAAGVVNLDQRVYERILALCGEP
jgi:LDH2 family malate/lactate/ureidoglycolate dehydrogenase